jgi:hypothetical protein
MLSKNLNKASPQPLSRGRGTQKKIVVICFKVLSFGEDLGEAKEAKKLNIKKQDHATSKT